jgi:hypothetical protein
MQERRPGRIAALFDLANFYGRFSANTSITHAGTNRAKGRVPSNKAASTIEPKLNGGSGCGWSTAPVAE